MAELIGCRSCDSPNCKGCNVYTLDEALRKKHFKLLMDEHHSVHINADVRPVVHSKWEQVEVLYVTENPNNTPEAIASMYCPECKRYHNEVFFYGNPVENVNFCPWCGADMKGNGNED